MRNLAVVRLAAAGAVTSMLIGLGSCTSSGPAVPVATATEAVTHAENPRVVKGARWTQHYFPSSDGSSTELHADVLLPENLPAGEKVPVILSVGAYFGHSGQTEIENHPHAGPSNRFYDFIEGTDLMSRGYAFVMVDLRGFGGSSGCSDFIGDGEQADVKAAIDWAAAQPWSTGSVGMYGKSYDAITGLVGNNLDPDALKAVVAQEPIWDLQRNIRSNGVPRTTAGNVATSYLRIAGLPPMPDDDERYRTNARYEEAHPECTIGYPLGFLTSDPDSPYWQTRDLARRAEGSDTPLFITQGFTEWNTEPEAMEEYLHRHQGPQRGWLGPWDHKRGNDRGPDGRWAMGRDSWFDETMSFYDEYLKGIAPSVGYPAFAVQDNTGRWRGQDRWPDVGNAPTISLPGGDYLDDGAEGEPGVDTGNHFFRWSAPLPRPTRITGTPRVSFVTTGHGNVMVRLFDVAPDGTGVMFDEQVAVVASGPTSFDLKATDWTLAAGHRLAVQVGTVQPPTVFGDWLDTPSNRRIGVDDLRLTVPLDDPEDDRPTAGEPALYLEVYTAVSTTPSMPIGAASFSLPATPR